jgi:hypothetical protein
MITNESTNREPVFAIARYCKQIVLSVIFTLCLPLFTTSAHADQFQAFYYDAQGLLLQVEAVRNQDLTGRKLVDINNSLMVVPMLTERVVPLLSGINLPMSKFATLAVYYTYDNPATPRATGSKDVQARPTKVEYLGFVGARTIARCVARDPNQPCLFPKRCHCMIGTCCCY